MNPNMYNTMPISVTAEKTAILKTPFSIYSIRLKVGVGIAGAISMYRSDFSTYLENQGRKVICGLCTLPDMRGIEPSP